MMQIANVLNVSPEYFFEGAPTAARISAKNQNSMDHISEFIASKDGSALMKAFVNLPKGVQHSLVCLVEKIADNERRKGPPAAPPVWSSPHVEALQEPIPAIQRSAGSAC